MLNGNFSTKRFLTACLTASFRQAFGMTGIIEEKKKDW